MIFCRMGSRPQPATGRRVAFAADREPPTVPGATAGDGLRRRIPRGVLQGDDRGVFGDYPPASL